MHGHVCRQLSVNSIKCRLPCVTDHDCPVNSLIGTKTVVYSSHGEASYQAALPEAASVRRWWPALFSTWLGPGQNLSLSSLSHCRTSPMDRNTHCAQSWRSGASQGELPKAGRSKRVGRQQCTGGRQASSKGIAGRSAPKQGASKWVCCNWQNWCYRR